MNVPTRHHNEDSFELELETTTGLHCELNVWKKRDYGAVWMINSDTKGKMGLLLHNGGRKQCGQSQPR